MANPLHSARSANLGLLLARLPVGVLFCLAGYQKIAHIGVSKFAAENASKVPAYMPAWFPKAFLSGLPFIEIALGALVVVGLFTRLSGLLLSCLLVSFLMITGIHDGSGGWPFHPNFFFLGTALMLLFTGGGGISVDRRLFERKHAKGGGFPSGQ
jgi:uncharacterized membrane protein YphA (DoxX/SURF4 family)